MKYNIDLGKMDVQTYKMFLKNQYLIPSRQILYENIDQNFKILENCGLKNLLDLKHAVGTNTKIDKLSRETTIPSEHLTKKEFHLKTFPSLIMILFQS